MLHLLVAGGCLDLEVVLLVGGIERRWTKQMKTKDNQHMENFADLHIT